MFHENETGETYQKNDSQICNDKFFKDERSKYLFCLTCLDGKCRNENIGLTDNLYDDKKKASDWYQNIVKTIDTDHS